MAMRLLAICLAAGLATIASQTEAATLRYYYVSAPYTISNYPGPDRPLFRTGYLEIDESELDSELGNSRLEILFDEPAAIRALEFTDRASSYNEFADSYITFDANKNISEWRIVDAALMADPDIFYANISDTLECCWSPEFVSGFIVKVYEDLTGMPGDSRFDYEAIVGAFLDQRGYRKGTAVYEALFADEDLFRHYTHSDTPGQWFTSLTDFASQIEYNTRAALNNPPRSVYDIAPIPVPAPLALLVAGLAALGALAGVRPNRRRVSPPPDRSG